MDREEMDGVIITRIIVHRHSALHIGRTVSILAE